MNRQAALLLAQQLVDYRASSMVADGRALAAWVLTEESHHEQLADELSAARARQAELYEQRRTLAQLIENIAHTDPEAQGQVIAAALTAARGMA